MSTPTSDPTGLPNFDEYAASFTAVEAPVMDEHDVIHRAIERVGVDMWADRAAVLDAVKVWRARELGGLDVGSEQWEWLLGRIRDAADRMPVTILRDLPGGAL